MKKFNEGLVLICLIASMFFCMAGSSVAGTATAFLATTPEYYEKYGISQTQIDKFEDGMRSSGCIGTYEWWYFDFNLSDGSTLVITYDTKHPGFAAYLPLWPYFTFTLTRPDGTVIKKEQYVPVPIPYVNWHASKTGCNVKIYNETVSGNLTDYKLHVDFDHDTYGKIVADITLHGTTPSWRPKTGHIVFKKDDGSEKYFAWLPSVPAGAAQVNMNIGGTVQNLTAEGYHDHNWGNASMDSLIHDWYWGRATVGNYNVISSFIVSNEKYNYSKIPIFLLTRNGTKVVDDGTKVTFSMSDFITDATTGKPVANNTVYDYNDGANHYRVTYHRQSTIAAESIAVLGGGYHRFLGTVTLEKFSGDTVVETVVNNAAVWELMWLASDAVYH